MASKAKRGEHWFEDGNIILVTDETPTAFRVHRGVLGRHSEVFQDMFSFPQPELSSDTEMCEGCQVVRLYDLSTDLSNLIKALYDGAFHDFIYLAGVLRLSTKYLIAHLRTEAIRCLTITWPYTLEGHDAMVNKAVSTLSKDGLSYPYVHPLHVLNLANEVNIRLIVPSTLYFLSLYPLADILRGDHPKLLVEHQSRLSSSLNPADMGAYTLMFQHRVKIILEFMRKERTPSVCCASELCQRGFQKQANRLLRSWQTRTGPLYFIVQAMNAVNEEPYLCDACRKAYRREADLLRHKIWKELPEAIGLPSWDDLVAADLPT
ncbi:hypothetical protein D9615_002840 [Tricholomella constricta]|uniref:BTB domain-containing protein n=1 Tax=Tricholomella constricta TaxID=117010 RepID=A0A8H5HG36_9AGAR|nr:hypothetical protein D9615_002840 [Tricholomella constricta]